MEEPPLGGSVYADLIAELVAREDVRKDSIEQRGVAVITTSGALSTLLLGLAAVNTHAKNWHLPASADDLLIAAVCLFFTAALLAISTNLPLRYAEVKAVGLWKQTGKRFGDDLAVAQRRVSFVRLRIAKRARRVNCVKAWLLFSAMCAEGLAVVCVAGAVVILL